MILIVNKFINELKAQVKDKGIKVKIDTDAVEWLIEQGFDSKMGARPLARVIDKEIKRPLAKIMLFGDLKAGGSLAITVNNNAIELIAKPKVPKLPLITVDNENIDSSQGN